MMKKIIGMVALGGLVITLVIFAATNSVFADGLRGLGNPGDGPGGRKRDVGPAKYLTQATAEVFGMTTAELEAAQKDGKSLLDIAAEKGLTVKDYQAKMKTVRGKAVDLALAVGDMTQKQADWMKSQNGRGRQIAGRRGGMMRGEGFLHEETIAAMAKVLGMEAKDLDAKLEAGERLNDIITEKGISKEDWPDKMKEAMANAITAAVANGKLTQAQADAMLERIENRPNLGPRSGDGDAAPPADAPAGGGPGGEGFMGPPDGLGFMDPDLGMLF